LNSFYAEYTRAENYTQLFKSAPAIDFMELISNAREDTMSSSAPAGPAPLLDEEGLGVVAHGTTAPDLSSYEGGDSLGDPFSSIEICPARSSSRCAMVSVRPSSESDQWSLK